MQFHRFDLNLLIALDTLLREKNITRAAEKVFVSQPAMSAALHRLRDYFDDPLLVRVGRDMELSPRGQSLVEPVREALLLIQATLGTQPTFTAATTQREFTLILSEEAVPGLLPAILEHVSTEAPGIRINIELVSHSILSRLEYGEADLCLCLDSLRLFDVRAYPGYSAQRAAASGAVGLHRRPGPSHRRRQHLGRAIFFIASCVRPAERLHGHGGRAGASAVEHRAARCTSPSPACCICRWCCGAPGWSPPCPSGWRRCSRPHCAVKTFPLPFETPPLHEILLWHKRHESDPAHKWLRDLVVRLTQKEM